MSKEETKKDADATKKLSVILDANLHRRAKRYALMQDMTLTDLVIELLEERLSQPLKSELTP
jgi:predicted HicB family RNase H-like nuclease